MLWSQWILTPSKPLSCRNGLEWKENGRSAEGTQNMSHLDLKHDERRRVRISLSRIRILTSKITQVCQDIRDIKLRQLLIT